MPINSVNARLAAKIPIISFIIIAVKMYKCESECSIKLENKKFQYYKAKKKHFFNWYSQQHSISFNYVNILVTFFSK